MATERVADMSVEELKTLIAEVVAQQLSQGGRSQNTGSLTADGYYVLPHRTQAEQRQRNQALLDLFRKWDEQGDEEETRETFEYLQQVLDNERAIAPISAPPTG